jgi:NAD-dependent SIR2 family protein deacetylase
MSQLLYHGQLEEEDLVLIIGTDTKTSYAADLLEIKTVRTLIYEKRKQFDYAKRFLEEE